MSGLGVAGGWQMEARFHVSERQLCLLSSGRAVGLQQVHKLISSISAQPGMYGRFAINVY